MDSYEAIAQTFAPIAECEPKDIVKFLQEQGETFIPPNLTNFSRQVVNVKAYIAMNKEYILEKIMFE